MSAAPRLLSPDEPGLAEAAALLAAGRIIGVPTETVYGLAGDARNGRAVAAIFAAKGRPRFNPLIVHVADAAAAFALGEASEAARALAAAFWPGPLTLVLPLAPGAGSRPSSPPASPPSPCACPRTPPPARSWRAPAPSPPPPPTPRAASAPPRRRTSSPASAPPSPR